MSHYFGRTVRSIELPGVPDRDHLLQMIPQKPGQPLDRDQIRESIRILFATGRFADIQAEVIPSGSDVVLTFATSLNFFVGAVDVEGAPGHPNTNQILNAAKFQLGELYSLDKLDRALQNVRQLMQENGYYRARVTAESTSNGRHPAGQYPLSHHAGRACASWRGERHRPLSLFRRASFRTSPECTPAIALRPPVSRIRFSACARSFRSSSACSLRCRSPNRNTIPIPTPSTIPI